MIVTILERIILLVKKVTITKKGYGIYKDKNLNKKVSTSDSNLNRTYNAKGYYDRFDGSRYYSLYDSSDQWVGYIDSNATVVR